MNAIPKEPNDARAPSPFTPHLNLFASDIVATIRAWGIEDHVRRMLDDRNDEMKPLGSLIDELEQRVFMPKLVAYKGEGFDIYDPGHAGFVYEHDGSPLVDARGAWTAVRHMGLKTWVGKETLIHLARAALAALDMREGRKVWPVVP